MSLQPANAIDEESSDVGQAMHALAAELYPICRSITGPGLRESLDVLHRRVPLSIHEVPSGTAVFDWHVPQEWRIRDAYIQDPAGRRVVDFRRLNLHVLQYSVPIHTRMSLADLRPHLFTLPDRPRWVPYRTSYYRPAWGFCLSHEQLQSLPDQEYEVCIDSELVDGSLSYGELFLPGQTNDEVLISAHTCHPSLANDNLSGLAVAVCLAQRLAARPRRYGYRFVFAPGCIGAIAWLSRNEDLLPRIRHGLVLSLLGDPGHSTYKKSRRGHATIDRVAAHVLQHSGKDYTLRDFEPLGYDERQYCSPGINLPVGCFMRTPPGQYPEYHTSADNLDFIRPEYLADSLAKCSAMLDIVEHNRAYRNRSPKGEPQLGRRGLYRSMGGTDNQQHERAMLWVLNFSDGHHTLLDIAERSGLPFAAVHAAAETLCQAELLDEAGKAFRLPPASTMTNAESQLPKE
jgi:aminopeptidase-like protein